MGLFPSDPLFLAELSSFLHKSCLSFTPKESPWLPFYEALLCGRPLPLEWKGSIQKLGLVHLYVVSGIHVLFLERALEKLPFSRGKFWWIFGILSLYAGFCQFSPPVTRALVHWSLKHLQRHQRWFWSPEQMSLYASATTLALFPHWLFSLSLPLSWTAALLLSSSLGNKSSLHKQITLYLGLSPLIFLFAPLHPISILMNLLFSPVMTVLLPLLFCTLFLPLAPVTDFIFQCMFQMFSWLELQWESSSPVFHISLPWVWVYVVFIHLLVHGHMYKKENRYFLFSF